jgi:Na+-transporting methylmalonyl-CoA/oxaloacetate decarboxylase gamma subunit
MMLAQLNPPDGLATWLACLAFIAVLLVNVGKVADRFRGRPSAAEVDQKSAERYVTRDDFLAHKQGIHAALSELRNKLDADSDKVLNRLDEVKAELSAASERRIVEVYHKLDAISAIAIRAEDRTNRES